MKRTKIKQLINSIAELAQLSIPENSVLSVNFPDSATMIQLNKTHLQHDYLTDVICFNYLEVDDIVEGEEIAVEIFISPDIAVLRSRANPELDYASEMVLYLVHAILHASGMSDKNPAQKQQMRDRESEIIFKIKNEFNFPEIFPL